MITWIGRRIRARYLKMNLVRNGEVIKRYYDKITKTGFIFDHKLSYAWRIPPPDYMIRDKKAYTFVASLENVEPFIYSDIDNEIKLNNEKLSNIEKEGLIENEISIPFLHLNTDNEMDYLERTRIILKEKKKISFRGKTYLPILKSINIPSLYEAMNGEALNQVMRAPKNKKEFNWMDILFWGALIVGVIVVAYYFIVLKHPPT